MVFTFNDERKGIQPRCIWCLGRNYAKHAEELGNLVEAKPLVFQKGLNALVPASGDHMLPRNRGSVHYETELVLLMEKKDGNSRINAIGLGLDLTLRDLQSTLKAGGKPWTLAKSFDGAAPVSRFIPVEEFKDLSAISFSMKLNGSIKQQGNSADMILPLEKIPEYLNEITDLQSGDIIFTGTPEGVGELQVGDEIILELADHPMGRLSFV